jgi:hypothetical protein
MRSDECPRDVVEALYHPAEDQSKLSARAKGYLAG